MFFNFYPCPHRWEQSILFKIRFPEKLFLNWLKGKKAGTKTGFFNYAMAIFLAGFGLASSFLGMLILKIPSS
jgi:hypothetical protein